MPQDFSAACNTKRVNVNHSHNFPPGAEAVQIYFWTLDEPVANFRTLVLTSTPGSGFGLGLASAGDLNQDGYADLIIGAPLEGIAYLEF